MPENKPAVMAFCNIPALITLKKIKAYYLYYGTHKKVFGNPAPAF